MKRVIGVLSANSTDYVEKVFSVLNQEGTVVNLKRIDDVIDIPGYQLTELLETEASSGWYQGQAYQPSAADSIAQILFSSGTEGDPKAICISHASLSNTVERLISVMQIDNTIREYIGVPVYYSFGFGRCRVVSAAGGEFFIPSKGFNPLEIKEMLEADEINAISAVPSLWRTILDTPELFSSCGARVKWIEIGSQYMAAHEKTQLVEIFPNAKIIQHYGLTEASRSTFLALHESTPSALESVGKPLYGVEVKIAESGRIFIKGPHIAKEIYQSGKKSPVTDEQGWFATNDQGRLEDGHLFFEGRVDDIINCGGIKLSPEKLDRQIATVIGESKGFHTFKQHDEELGEFVGIAKLKSKKIDSEKLKSALNETLKNYGITAGARSRIVDVDSFPVTETGKLKRKELNATLLSQPAPNANRDMPESETQDVKAKVLAIWQETLRINEISENESFFDLGGDSLSAIRVMLRMEAAGIPKDVCQRVFEGITIAEIAGHNDAESTQHSTNSIQRTPLATGGLTVNIARGLLVILNILAHWNLGVVERLPSIFAEINRYLAPLYSSGTPGFAAVFGVGVGFFIYPRFKKHASSVNSLIVRNAIILGSGIILMSVLSISLDIFKDEPITALGVSNSLYSVIYFYFFAVISIPLWLKILHNRANFSVMCLLGASALYGCHLAIDYIDIPPSKNPLVQPWILLLTAKYNYPEMFAGVLFGAAIGNWFRERVEANRQVNDFILYGLLFICLSAFISIDAQQSRFWLIWPKGLFLWSWFCYTGMVMIILSLTYNYLKVYDVNTHRKFGLVLKIVSIVGIMAFPFFIGHELVLPLVDLLRMLDVPGAIPVALLIFFSVATPFIRKLYQLYFGSQRLADRLPQQEI